MKTLIIDGSKFDNTESFQHEMLSLFAPGNDFKRMDLDGLNDFLRGGWGAFEEDEFVNIIWRYHEKSQKDLGADYYDQVIRVIKDSEHQDRVTLVLE